MDLFCINGRSREGAWIEIGVTNSITAALTVAPVRERGLKCSPLLERLWPYGRSREGAWIEIVTGATTHFLDLRRSREGAWIEIAKRSIEVPAELLSLP